MTKTRIAIIGGTGLGEAFAAEGSGETVSVDTPFGKPSSDITLTKWAGVDIALLARHGAGHSRGIGVVCSATPAFSATQFPRRHSSDVEHIAHS